MATTMAAVEKSRNAAQILGSNLSETVTDKAKEIFKSGRRMDVLFDQDGRIGTVVMVSKGHVNEIQKVVKDKDGRYVLVSE
jgi:hypothetical protein